MGFVADLPDRVILDDVQRVPEVLAALKMEVDRRRAPGRFALTGSTNVLLIPNLSDSLAGRLQIVRLHPLAQCELAVGSRSDFNSHLPFGFLDDLLGGRFKTRRTRRLGKGLLERIVAGGFPAALRRPSGRRRSNLYRDYIATLVQRDMQDRARIRVLEALPRFPSAASSQTAKLFNLADLSSPLQLGASLTWKRIVSNHIGGFPLQWVVFRLKALRFAFRRFHCHLPTFSIERRWSSRRRRSDRISPTRATSTPPARRPFPSVDQTFSCAR